MTLLDRGEISAEEIKKIPELRKTLTWAQVAGALGKSPKLIDHIRRHKVWKYI